MKAAPSCCCPSRLLAPALLLLLLPALSRPLAVLLRAAEAAPDSGPRDPGPRTLLPGCTPAEAAGRRAPRTVMAAAPGRSLRDDHGRKAGEGGSVGGSLAVSPNPGDNPMTQRALTVLMVVRGAVLENFIVRVRTVRVRRRNRKTRKYGVLDTNIENMELTPLEQDEEEDDNTLFDASHPRR
ncbi:membrane protein FAM174A-like [Choloepus didactylus]|uniref:membrane protein FAM174A-like n=1 Tax=Choloepus didactylus TaxID=27675 RepID=UPI00189E9E69|nr:membrane protein FAM174A-like [Choloepus didactylus]